MRYFIHVQKQSGVPFLFVMLVLSVISIITGFFIRGVFSFLFRETTTPFLLLIDWFLFFGLTGFVVSTIGVIAGTLYFLYKMRQMVMHQNQSDYEYNAEFQRIDQSNHPNS